MADGSISNETPEDRQPGAVGARGNVDGSDGAQTAIEGQFAELRVNLVFVAGRLQLTVAELQQIQPGHVFDLRRVADRHIEITANGAAIGVGELVEVDGRVGVRVHECK